MSDAPDHDRIIDRLLEEQLGGDRPPDLRARILRTAGVEHRSQPAQPRRRRRLEPILAVACVATVLLLAVGVIIPMFMPVRESGPPTRLAPDQNPAILAAGDIRVEDGGPARIGQWLEVGPKGAKLTIAEFCQVEVAAKSKLKVENPDAGPQVVLDSGGVKCQIEPGRGAFAVRTAHATAAVVGTQFDVKLSHIENDPTRGLITLVHVKEGSVKVAGRLGERLLRAGDEWAVSEHFAYGGGDLWFRGKLAEGRAGWTLIENNGRERLVLPRGSAAQAMPKFREGVEYIVIMRQGKLKEAHTVEGERRRGDY